MWRLFEWFTRRRRRTPFINREEFVEDLNSDENISNSNTENMDYTTTVNNMQHPDMVLESRKELDDFLARDFEPQGYKDALINADSSNAEENKEILKAQLDLKIERVLTIYENKIMDYDFHIKTRSQNGLMDTVDEVNAEKGKVLEEIKKIKVIQAEAKENRGQGHVIILSYDRGFKRGLAALTSAKLFGKSLNNE